MKVGILNFWHSLWSDDHPARHLPRWLPIAAALALAALAFGSTGHRTAQAAPPADRVAVSITVSPGSLTLCEDSSKPVNVQIHRTVTREAQGRTGRGQEIAVEQLVGVSVSAVSNNTAVATVRAGLGTPDDAIIPFTVEGLDPGTTTIDFTALVSSFWVQSTGASGQLSQPRYVYTHAAVTVKKCNYRVHSTYRAAIGPALYSGWMEPVTLEVGANNSLSGTGTFQWTETYSACGITTSPSLLSTQAHISGQVQEKAVTINITYDPITHANHYNCAGGYTATVPDDHFGPNNITVPLSGGSTSSRVKGNAYGSAYSGNFLIVVEREEE